ncbi:MAG: FprA family A-type flavoprotein [Culicoidibacterales bacterium]
MPNALKIRDNIYWVGALDWEVRDIHCNTVPYGTTYNAYLIIDGDDVLLIDTVHPDFVGEMISRIQSVIQPEKITHILVNHAETDHSAGLPTIMAHAPNASIYCSAKSGVKSIVQHYHQNDWKFIELNTNDTFQIGKYEFAAILLPFVHWPESMGVYLISEKILFPNDAFGQHIATSERFDTDGYPLDLVFREAKRYYANIVMAYNPAVAKSLPQIEALNIEMICPSHGIIWTEKENIDKIISLYSDWANQVTDGRAAIVYDTMADSTKKMAYAIRDVLEEFGIQHRIYNLQSDSVSEVLTDVMTAEYIFIGSPTFNKTVLPTVGAFLSYIKGFAPKKRKGMAFGTYGWGNISNKEIENIMTQLDWDIIPGMSAQYIPTDDQLEDLRNHIRSEINKRYNV